MFNLSYRQKLVEYIWAPGLEQLVWWKRLLINFARFFYLIFADLSSGQLNLRAMSLVFTTMLSFVPLIAVSFSVLKAFDVHNEIEPILVNALAPLGPQAQHITENVIGFVDNVKVGLLGAVGIGFLFYSVLSLVQKVEESFNYTWRIERSRSLMERFSTYLSVIMVGPVLVFAALGLTASFSNNNIVQAIASIEPFGTLIAGISFVLPYLLIIAAFTFLYIFVPNTKVRLIPAITGGVVAGVLWQTVGWVYAVIVAMSTAKAAIYASFAILFFFMTWLYLNWLILLVGSSVAFYRQYPEYLMAESRNIRLSNIDRESLALTILLEMGRAYYQKLPPPSVADLTDRIHYPKQPMCDLLQSLERAGLVRKLEAPTETYLLAAPAESVSVADVLGVVRHNHMRSITSALGGDLATTVNQVMSSLENSIQQNLGGISLKEFIMRSGVSVEEVDSSSSVPDRQVKTAISK